VHSFPIVALTRGFPLAPFGRSGTPETVPMMADGSQLRSRGETWGPVSPDNVHKTGVSPGGRSGSPSWPPEAEQAERTRRKPWSRARSRFLCPTGPATRNRRAHRGKARLRLADWSDRRNSPASHPRIAPEPKSGLVSGALRARRRRSLGADRSFSAIANSVPLARSSSLTQHSPRGEMGVASGRPSAYEHWRISQAPSHALAVRSSRRIQ